MNPKVDFYFHKAKKWQQELMKLRAIILDCELDEELKWGKPCYSSEGRNIVIIVGFKEHCALLLFKGALMRDPNGILVIPGENTQGGRQIRLTSLQQIVEMEPVLKSYIREAVEVEISGAKVELTKSANLDLADELITRLNDDPALKTAFESLTPGRQRAYNIFFTGAKQPKTREARVEKCIPQILERKGLTDS